MTGTETDPRWVIVARGLVIVSFVTMMFSPPATNLLQAILFGVCLASRDVRARLWAARRQPLVVGALLFYVALIIGASYSIAGLREGFGMVWGWRKLLMLPIAAALFTDSRAKVKLLRTLVAAAGCVAVASFVAVLAKASMPHFIGDGDPGVLVRNHATQGMVFAMAAFAGASLALFPAMGESLQRRRVWAIAAMVLAANVILVTPGRSGYLALLVSAVCLGAGWAISRGISLARTALVALAAAATLGAALALSPLSKQRIAQATSEMQTYSRAKELTSMGIRMYFWQNAIDLVKQRPVLGWGTGGFEAAYSQQVAGREGLAGVGTSDPHNQFLKIAAEQGLLGLAIFLGFLLMAFRQRPELHFRLMGLCALAVWCATSMANSHFSTYAEGTFIYLWLGVMLAFQPSTHRPDQACV